ncbi:MAG: MFS transporter [Thermoprotei archaeon]
MSFNYSRRWTVVSVTTLGTLMSAIDSTIVILGIPLIMQSIHANLIEMAWVIMGYILMSTSLVLAIGRIGDNYGRIKVYEMGFLVFTLGSALSGLSFNGAELVTFRFVQGIGGAMMIGNSWALISEAFPENERGKAFGINSIAWGVGGVVAPIIGGVIITYLGWRYIFYVNVPIGLFAVLWARFRLKGFVEVKKKETFDILGAALFTIFISLLLIAITMSIGVGWDFLNSAILFASFLVLFTFFFVETKVNSPIFKFNLFKNRVYFASTGASFLQSLAMFAIMFLVIFYLEGVKGYSIIESSILLIPMPLLSSVLAPVGGAISDKVGARIPATIGIIIQAFALYILSGLTVLSPYFLIAAGLGIMGVGSGLFFSPNASAVMSSTPRGYYGVGSGMMTTLRNTGQVISIALALLIASWAMPQSAVFALFLGSGVNINRSVMLSYVKGMDYAFRLSIMLAVLAAVASFIRGKENRRSLEVEAKSVNPLGKT